MIYRQKLQDFATEAALLTLLVFENAGNCLWENLINLIEKK